MRWVNVRRFQGADLFTTKRRVVGHRQHHPVAQPLLFANFQDGLPVFFVWNPRKPVLPLNEAAPGYSRAQRVSRADSLFHQEVMKEPSYCQMLLQSCMRERCPHLQPLFPNPGNGQISNAPDVSSDGWANN